MVVHHVSNLKLTIVVGEKKMLTIVFNASAGCNRIMTNTRLQLAYRHGLSAELPSHVFNPDKQVYH